MNEILQSVLIDLIALEEIDRSLHFAVEVGVKEMVWIPEARSVGKGELHLLFVGVGDRNYSVA